MSELTVPDPRLVEHLRDLHLPVTPHGWPIASGWWFVLFVLAALIIAQTFRVVHRRNRESAQSPLVDALDQHYQEWMQHGRDSRYLQGIGQLLRAYAISTVDRQSVAKLTGTDWIHWLEQRHPYTFSSATSLALSQECYRSDPIIGVSQLHEELSRWAQCQTTLTPVVTPT